nr:MAG TPA: Large Terminase [Caudoviricetes sp.]
MIDTFANAPVRAGFKPRYKGEVPTLGYIALEWMETYLSRPTVTWDEPFRPTREQAEFILRWYRIDPITGERVYRRGVIQRPKGWGKAEYLGNLVPTPQGYRRFGDLKVGDYVFGSDGKPTEIIQVHPTIEDYGYIIKASDGSFGTFHENHTFVVGEFTGSGRYEAELSVGEMSSKGVKFDRALTKGRTKATNPGVSRFALQEPPCLYGVDRGLAIDPYVLGFWLGDGDSDCGRVTINAADFQEVKTFLPIESAKQQWNTRRTAVRVTVPGLKPKLRVCGLLGDKHIPEVYLRASEESRRALLQGLMDSDGHIETIGVRAEYCTTSESLAMGVQELLFSLGYRPRMQVGEAKLNGRVVSPKYRIRFRPQPDNLPARLSRKLGRIKPAKKAMQPRTIKSITRTETPIRMRCITVAAEDGQYLTGTSHWVTHNSPFLAAIAAFEALGPCRFAGWDSNGRPVGQPWNAERKVEITLLAVSEEQTRNAFEPMKEMMSSEHLLWEYPGVEVMETRILLPHNGLIAPRTSSARSLEGKPNQFTIADQTETWVPSNGGDRLGAVAKRNLSKADGTLLEAPNAFVPGEGSFAEQTWNAWQKGMAGESFRNNILYDTRDWGDPDLSDPSSIITGLEHAYGDSLKSPTGCKIHTPPCGVEGSPYPGGWVRINGVLDDVFDPATTLSDAARYFGNKPHASADAFIPYDVLHATTHENLEASGIDPITRQDMLVVGFDGSWGRSRGVTDATAIVAMRVSDGLAWAVRVWEQPDDESGRGWEPPRAEIDDVMRKFIKDFNVVDGLFDPAGWESLAAEWESLINAKRASARRGSKYGFGSMLWRGNQLNRVAEATRSLRVALYEREVKLTGPGVLMRHLNNAQYRETKAGKIMYKESPSSARKIDAAYALMLAYQSKLRVSAKGHTISPARESAAPMRLR